MGMKVGLVPARVIQVQGAEAGSPAELSCPGVLPLGQGARIEGAPPLLSACPSSRAVGG